MINKNINYNPDVLDALANLSNDEVFTPPKIVNQVLDNLPQELWSDKNATFLDPVTKSGVFLREIAKRLNKWLAKEIPDLEERLNHIFKKQLFGIAITELTGLLARRTLYCSKIANGKYSVCDAFDDKNGNIDFERIEHTWEGKRCKYCGASKEEYDREDILETHAYKFIHNYKPNMKFDVIIGNPPYQLNDGGNAASAMPIYQKFVDQAKKLNPRFLTMIIPSRWFSGGKGLDSFREEMLNDDRMRQIHDFFNASDVFPGVEIKGGVCYFLWDRDNKGLCEVSSYENAKIISKMERPLLEKDQDVFIRYNRAISILKKVLAKNEQSFSEIVSSQKPFGLRTFFKGIKDKFDNSVKVYANKNIGYIKEEQILKNKEWQDEHKVIIPRAIGSGNSKTDIIKPIYSEPNSCCTETYIVVRNNFTKQNTNNVITYIQTKFFHFLVTLQKNTMMASKTVYKFVPMQDFSKPWTDEELYKKYDLSQEEIDFIESMIRPME